MGDRTRNLIEKPSGRQAALTHDSSSIVVGTLSWARDPDDDHQLSGVRFLGALRSALTAGPDSSPHVVLCAGHTLAKLPPAHAILEASGGTPVIFETDNGDNNSSYRLAIAVEGKARSIVLRNRQLVVHAEDAKPSHKLQQALVDLVAQGAGVIEAMPGALRFLLLICGENNAVRHSGSASVMPGGQKADLWPLRDRWILLNPAHKAYSSVGGGRVKVEEGQYGHGPMLGHLAAAGRTFNDQTKTPEAVVHCNNFYTGASERSVATRRNATLVFTRKHPGQRRKPLLRIADTGPILESSSWIHARYRLS